VSLSVIFFIIVGTLAIASALLTVYSRSPIVSAMALVFHFFMLAGLYLTLNAQFVAVLQVLVYAGAIMVLVIFVIMLLNLKDEEFFKEKFNFRKILAVIFAIGLIVQFISIYFSKVSVNTSLPVLSEQIGTPQAIGVNLFTNYLVPFEAVTLLLIVAIIGALVLAKRKID
jgi:NADH-quinone oxidoreductase subunit J